MLLKTPLNSAVKIYLSQYKLSQEQTKQWSRNWSLFHLFIIFRTTTRGLNFFHQISSKTSSFKVRQVWVRIPPLFEPVSSSVPATWLSPGLTSWLWRWDHVYEDDTHFLGTVPSSSCWIPGKLISLKCFWGCLPRTDLPTNWPHIVVRTARGTQVHPVFWAQSRLCCRFSSKDKAGDHQVPEIILLLGPQNPFPAWPEFLSCPGGWKFVKIMSRDVGF